MQKSRSRSLERTLLNCANNSQLKMKLSLKTSGDAWGFQLTGPRRIKPLTRMLNGSANLHFCATSRVVRHINLRHQLCGTSLSAQQWPKPSLKTAKFLAHFIELDFHPHLIKATRSSLKQPDRNCSLPALPSWRTRTTRGTNHCLVPT